MRTPVTERFLSYVAFDTQSSNDSETTPSTAKQLELAKFLAEECKSIGLSEVRTDEYGYVTATLAANTDNAPVVGFLAHMDTSPDASGANVAPQIIYDYDGGDIILNESMVLSPDEFPDLKNYTGQTVIATDGRTLLGADDKAGIAEILSAMEYLIQHPQIPHGRIRIAFTTDEEIGTGADKLDLHDFGADFAYTIDGGRLGEFERENFNAARAVFEITGKGIHPGTAKGIMRNAGLIAAELISAFPADETPATTEGYEGFFHMTRITGEVEKAMLDYRIRCFDLDEFAKRKRFVEELAAKANARYGAGTVKLKLYDEYLNMKEKIDEHPEIAELAIKAYAAAGVEVLEIPIRGGTDGSRLSYEGLPCPNIFAGGHNFHGPYEFIAAESMEKAVEVIINICKLAVKGDSK